MYVYDRQLPDNDCLEARDKLLATFTIWLIPPFECDMQNHIDDQFRRMRRASVGKYLYDYWKVV